MSLTISAPARMALSATTALVVSTETATGRSCSGRPEIPSRMGRTRRSSSSALTGSAYGRLDSPPMSAISGKPRAASAIWPMRRKAAVGSRCRPPSEKESGVALTTPMMQKGAGFKTLPPSISQSRERLTRTCPCRQSCRCRNLPFPVYPWAQGRSSRRLLPSVRLRPWPYSRLLLPFRPWAPVLPRA